MKSFKNFLKESVSNYHEEHMDVDNQIGALLVAKIDEAIDTYGRYGYLDSHISETMNVKEILQELHDMSSEEVGSALCYVMDNHDEAEKFVSDILALLEDRQDFYDIYEYDERFEY